MVADRAPSWCGADPTTSLAQARACSAESLIDASRVAIKSRVTINLASTNQDLLNPWSHQGKMLPVGHRSRYRIYKRGTDICAGWLAETAKKCGYDSKLTEKKPTGAGRLKGKARKEAKLKAHAGSSATVGGPKKKRYIMALKDFVPMAQFIAGYKPAVKVPEHIAHTINNVISLRRTVGAFLRQETQTVDQISDARHEFFLGVLEDVRSILKPLFAPDALISSTVTEPVPGTESSKDNIFDILDRYEPSQAFMDAPDAGLPTAAEAEYEIEEPDTLEDAVVAFTLLMKDILKLRHQVAELWHNYAEGTLSLSPVAVATNTAIQLARSMEQEIAPLVNKHGKVEKFLHIIYECMCENAGLDFEIKNPTTDPMNAIKMQTYDIADYTMIVVMKALGGFQRACPPGHIQAYNGQFGWYDEDLDIGSASNKAKYVQDLTALFEILPEIVTSLRVFPHPCQDEFTREVKTMLDTGEVSFSLVLAGQIYLDILRTLHGRLDRPRMEMTHQNMSQENSIQTVMESRGGARTNTWPPQNDLLLKEHVRLAKFWLSDPINTYKTKCGLPTTKPNFFLTRHPLFCGTWLHFMRTEFHETGVTYANAWGSVLYTYHLYHALHSLGAVDPKSQRWNDMDLLAVMQGMKTFFVGDPPRDPEGYFRNFCLCMGYAAANWAPHKRQGKGTGPLAAKTGPRGLKLLAPVSMLFKVDFNSKAPAALGVDDVRKILEASEWSQEQTEEGIVMEKEVISDGTGTQRSQSKWKNKGKEKDKGKDAEAKKSQDGVAPAELVRSVALALHPEVPELTFDYLLLHKVCWVQLSSLHKFMGPHFQHWFGPNYLEQESQLSFLVGYIFMAASRKVGGPLDDHMELMLRAGSILEVFLQTEDTPRWVIDTMENLGVPVQLQEVQDDEDDE